MNDEQFLARWSRRKQEAAAGHAEPGRDEAAEVYEPAPSEGATPVPACPETELSNLPAIESIDADTDITAFLRKGIPQELSRAALRRAWSADPAIRDFVGLAENAWDFNDPNAMAGFGTLDYSAEQVDALVRRIIGGVAQTAENLLDPPAEVTGDAARSAPAKADVTQSSDPVKALTDPRPLNEPAASELPSDSAASQPAAANEANEANEETLLPRRTHGGALPR
jgi:hypothetical protein